MRSLAKLRRPRSMSVAIEPLELRTLMAANSGLDVSAAVLGTQQADAASFPRFGSEELLRQQMLEAAIEQYKSQIGQPFEAPWWYAPANSNPFFTANSNPFITYVGRPLLSAYLAPSTTERVAAVSQTNVQIAGVDEADLVETDGDYIYCFDDSALVIIDARSAGNPRLASHTNVRGTISGMYLLGDRLTVIAHRSFSGPTTPDGAERPAFDNSMLSGTGILVAVYDVSDRTSPKLVTETDFEGTLIQSRMIDSQVYLVTRDSLSFPPPVIIPSDSLDANQKGWLVYQSLLPIESDGIRTEWNQPYPYWQQPWVSNSFESEVDYRTRVGEQILEMVLPKYALYASDGQFVRSGRLSNASNIYDRDLADNDNLVSVLVFDATGSATGPRASTTVPAGNVTRIHVSPSSIYLVEDNFVEQQRVSTIYRLAIHHGVIDLMSIGEVPGRVIDSFALDEYNGYLRVATQTGSGVGAHNGVYVLESSGLAMNIVGRLDNLTPGESLNATRFLGDRAFLVTFGMQATSPTPNFRDPLLCVDLSDPTHPQLRGELVIPGFSNYLQIVDGHYLIGFGRDADPDSGQWTDAQVSLFDVANLDNPVLVGRFSIPDSRSASSDAFSDHHAIRYFADQHLLAIPMSASGQMWEFKIDPSAPEAVRSLGAINMSDTVRRGVRIDDVLYSVARHSVQASRLGEPTTKLGELYFGQHFLQHFLQRAQKTSFTLDHNIPSQTLAVIGRLGIPEGIKSDLHITAIGMPQFGSVMIASDGKSVVYTLPSDLTQRSDRFTYTITDAHGRSEQAIVEIQVSWGAEASRLLQAVKADLATKLGVSVGQLSTMRPYTLTSKKYTPPEKIWTDATLATSEGAATEPTPGFEITLYYGSNVFVYHTDLGVRFIEAKETLDSGPDEFVVAENSGDNVLDVTANDYAGVRTYKQPQLVSVSSGSYGGMARLSDDGKKVLYTPPVGYIGVDELTYTLANGEVKKIHLRIPWDRLADGAMALAIADLAHHVGRAVEEIASQVHVQSINQQVDVNNQIAHQVLGEAFQNMPTIGFEIKLNYRGTDVHYQTNSDRAAILAYAPGLGVVDEFHVAENSVPVELRVQDNDFPINNKFNTHHFFTNRVSPQPITVPGSSSAGAQVKVVAGGAIRYTPPVDFTGTDTFTYTKGNQTVPVTVTVEPSVQQIPYQVVARDDADDATDLDQDGLLTALDALLLVNHLNSNQRSVTNPENSQPGIAERLGFGVRHGRWQSWDPDGSGQLDALDVVRLVNRLNQRTAAHDLALAGL